MEGLKVERKRRKWKNTCREKCLDEKLNERIDIDVKGIIVTKMQRRRWKIENGKNGIERNDEHVKIIRID